MSMCRAMAPILALISLLLTTCTLAPTPDATTITPPAPTAAPVVIATAESTATPEPRQPSTPTPLARIIHMAGEKTNGAGRRRSTDRLWELTEPTTGRCFHVSVCHSDWNGRWLPLPAGRCQSWRAR